jgi:hypothetical protein
MTGGVVPVPTLYAIAPRQPSRTITTAKNLFRLNMSILMYKLSKAKALNYKGPAKHTEPTDDLRCHPTKPQQRFPSI